MFVFLIDGFDATSWLLKTSEDAEHFNTTTFASYKTSPFSNKKTDLLQISL